LDKELFIYEKDFHENNQGPRIPYKRR